MDKIEWFVRVAGYRGKEAPFGNPFVRGSFLYATDGFCVLRSSFEDPEVAEEFSAEGLDLASFWKTLNASYKSLVPKGKIDALLLKEMAGDPDWGGVKREETRVIKVAGAYFYSALLANALAGWEEPEARFGRIESNDLMLKAAREKKVSAKAANMPIVLTGKTQVIILPFVAEEDQEHDEFPEGALVTE